MKSQVRGLSVPGMPVGWPGMGVGGENDSSAAVPFGPTGQMTFARCRGFRQV
ncbi:DUF411 domain-containing protein (plasmid) [Microvirga terrae]|uniref:DUF411 domain-containing protein n=1 Tax=Microvirga terrae TaxID=2740529 RepID=A0ABY5S368_9HYPH|nr:DUF411 domain-containing protein [Microvirga terrae]UVF22827.1 DUF411 domain-containing protein [Microvirga terrae]